METILKKAKTKDLSLISKIYMKEFSKPPYNEKWTMKKALSKMKFFNKFYDLYIVNFNKKIIGFVVINPIFMFPGEVAFGEEMAIQEDFQNQGIGTNVLKQLFNIYRKKGFKKFMGIAASNGRPINLYKRLGILPSKKGVLIEKTLK